jgi:16S rRNA (cytosine1402-N4)-methyltransferase
MERQCSQPPAPRHVPVMLPQVLQCLQPRPGGLYVDGTLGEGGHALGILEASAPDGALVGIDRDLKALKIARERLAPFGDRVTLVHGDFRDLDDILEKLGVGPPSGILLDLGVSSLQLDDATRGFSFRQDGPLDMRMDTTSPTTAADIVARMSERDLRALLLRFGEAGRAGAIARAIVRERARRPITTTAHLAETIVSAVPPKYRRGKVHPATRTFMALRTVVNDELTSLDAALAKGALLLSPGGRICVLSYHSLEHRAVRGALRELAKRCRCPQDLAECRCGGRQEVVMLTPKGLAPSAEEIVANPRSRSARLWCAERV